jgi:hypothetical protein
MPSGVLTSILAPIYAAARRSAKIRENGFTGIELKILPRLNGINPTCNGRRCSDAHPPHHCRCSDAHPPHHGSSVVVPLPAWLCPRRVRGRHAAQQTLVGAKRCHIGNKVRAYLARLPRNRGRSPDPVRTRRPSRASRRGARLRPFYELSFTKSQYEPKNAIFCLSLLPPSEPLLRSLQKATDEPLARRGSSSQVFDLACFVGDDGERRERRLRIFSLLFPADGESPDDAGHTRPFFATLAASLVEARPRRRDGCARGVPRA